jgi:hypothetical protein
MILPLISKLDAFGIGRGFTSRGAVGLGRTGQIEPDRSTSRQAGAAQRQCAARSSSAIEGSSCRSSPASLCRSIFRQRMVEALLNTLAGYNGAFERIGAAMQDIADVLRERKVSWATIGEALAVSRQAAWKRFG